MSNVVFNKYKSFYIPKSPQEPVRTSGNKIQTNGFDFLKWNTEDEEIEFEADSEFESKLEAENGAVSDEKAGSPDLEASLSTSSSTSRTESLSSTPNAQSKLLSEPSDDIKADNEEQSSRLIPGRKSLTQNVKAKLSKTEKKKLKQEKKLNKKISSRTKKVQEENEVVAAGNDLDNPERRHHFFHRHHAGQTETSGEIDYVNSSAKLTIKEKLHYLKSLYLSLVNTKSNKVLDFHDVTIFKEDIYNLNQDEWLNDNNLSYIYEYFEKVQLENFIQSNHALMNSKQALRFKNSIMLLKPSIAFLLLRSQDPTSLKGILPPLELASFIFIPINDNQDLDLPEGGSHWSLIVISVLDAKAFVYDTLSDEEDENNNPEALDLVRNLNLYLSANVGASHFREVKPLKVKTPQQINSNDCGVHVLQISAILLSKLIYSEENKAVDFRLDNLMISALDGRIFILQTILNELKKKSGQELVNVS